MLINRKQPFVFVVTLLVLLGLSLPTAAITNGQQDGDGHPYVATVGAVVNNEMMLCSGAAISSNILITAAHCFEVSGQVVFVTFDPDGPLDPNSEIHLGFWYPHPDLYLGCGPGLPGFDTNDVAVVVLLQPGFSLDRYAVPPAEGLIDTLSIGTEVTKLTQQTSLSKGELIQNKVSESVTDVINLNIKVLNGNGKIHSAKKMAKRLRDMGYSIELVADAPRFNFSQNTVFYGSEFQKEARLLVSSLGGRSISKPLTWSSIFDIIVVTGLDR